MVHPVQSVIESLYAAGRCPRLHVNATFEEVVCPAFIREQWRERLIIDLDPSYPLDLTFEENGIAADLSFGGYVTRCKFPWGAIYVVADRSTGRGIVLDQNMPESVRRSRYGRPQAGGGTAVPLASRGPTPVGTPTLRVKDGEANRTPSPSPARVGLEAAELPEPAAAPASAPPADTAASSDATAPESRASETAVKQRRAAFRVIDGG